MGTPMGIEPVRGSAMIEEAIASVARAGTALTENIASVLLGKRAQIEHLVVALLCRGHALVEDVPGTGKTILARATAASLDLRFRRIQCTPDLLPSDITGVRVFHQHSGSFEFQPGPVFTNVLLADEINRATPRTQSALLQAMEEGEVTVDGLPQSLPRPFLVLATQNPIEFEGTFPLPEAQLDRFLLRLSLGYPEGSDEIGIVHAQARGHPVAQLGPVLAADELLLLSGFIADVYMHPDLERYLLRIVHATRRHPALLLGASTRATVGLYRSAQALAALRGREYVAPEDIKEMAPPVLMHRLVLRPEELIRNVSAHAVVAQILEETHVDADEA